MEIKGIRAFEGRNVYSHRPVVEMKLYLGVYDGISSAELGDFSCRLMKLLPGLREHYCSEGRPGGFAYRLEEGTYLGHIVEHVALELQCMAGMEVFYGKTLGAGSPGTYKVVYEYAVKEAGLYAGEMAVRLVASLLERQEVSVDLSPLNRLVAEYGLGPSTAAIVNAARRRGIPVIRLNERSLLQLGYGKFQKRVQATITALTPCIGVDIASDKTMTKQLLAEAGIPVPPGGVASTEEEALAIAASIGFPAAVKPHDGNQGKGVALNLCSEKDIRAAFRVARNYSDRIIVEKHIQGKHYRILVVGDKVVAASERIPAHVIGDGHHTIRELIEMVNQHPDRGEGHEKPLTRIKVDPVVLLVLARQQMSLNDVPPSGQKIYLRDNANLSTGGIAVDVTDRVHPANAELALRVARIVGLDVAGVDVVAPDLALPLCSTGGAVIEANACPGIRMHHFPSEGMPRDAAGAIVDWLFPPGTPSRIPVVAVTGTNGKTTVTRLISHVLSLCGYRVGMTTTDGIYIGGQLIMEGDAAGPRSARAVLRDPSVEAAVLETARGGLLAGGLGFDWCDVGVVTNISEDHLGQEDVYTLEDLAHVKSLVVEAVKPDGYAVLNADDPLVLAMAARAQCRISLFSTKQANPALLNHLEQGGMGVYVKNGQLIVASGQLERKLISVKEVPLTYMGMALHNLENVAAASAACVALGVPLEILRRGLKGFSPTEHHVPGRLNLIKMGHLRVLVDYGHNRAAYEAVLRLAQKLKESRLLGVIGVPGDRCNESIRRIGHIAASGFDYIIIKEDQDKRGRAPGEVAGLLMEGVLEAGFPRVNVEIILPEPEAVAAALTMARAGDLLVVFFEKYREVMEVIAKAERGSTCRENLVVAGTIVEESR